MSEPIQPRTSIWITIFKNYPKSLSSLPEPAFDSDLTAPENKQIVRDVVQVMSGYLSTVEKGFNEIFREFPEGLDFEKFRFATRVYNTLRREDIYPTQNLARLSPAKFLSLKQSGLVSFEELLSSLILTALKVHYGQLKEDSISTGNGGLDESGSSNNSESAEHQGDVLTPTVPELVQEAIVEFGYFMHYSGKRESSLLGAAAALESPFVADLNQRLASFTVSELFAEWELPTVFDYWQEFVDSLNETEKAVLSDALIRSGPGGTVKVEGRNKPVTAEMTRSIGKKIRLKYQAFKENNRLVLIAMEGFLFQFDIPKRYVALKRSYPQLVMKVDGVSATFAELLTTFEPVAISEKWVYSLSPDAGLQFENIWAECLVLREYPTLQELHQLVQTVWLGFEKQELRSFLTFLGYKEYKKKWYEDRGLSQIAKAKIAIGIEGRPLTQDELLNFIGPEVSKRSFLSRLSEDDEVERTSLGTYALKSMGLQTYASIHKNMIDLIAIQGPTPLEEVVADFEEKFKVKPKSVRAYARAFPLTVVDGLIIPTSKVPKSRKNWQNSRNVYKSGDGFAYRLTVTADSFRGSGVACNMGLASALGISVNQSVRYSYGSTGVLVSTKSAISVTVGSIKTICEELSAEVGDEITLIFQGDKVQPVLVNDSLFGDDLIRKKIGAREGLSLHQALSEAFGLHGDISKSDLLEKIRSRKELDLLELVEQVSF